MTITVRFAPSPTGNIHLGNARPALINWLFALQNNGRFILRFDDTDTERSREEYVEGIARDIDWLGILPHQVERQSLRADQHDASAQRLKDEGCLYACYETPEQLDRQRKRQAARGLPPVYDRSALRLNDEQRKELEAAGIRPHWRFLLPNHAGDPLSPTRTDVTWDDIIRGRQNVDLASMSDPVLIRGDGTYLYTLPSVVDDIDLGVTHILRGDDHVTNTGAQIALFRALGSEPSVFGHHNLLTTQSGEGLSKRLGSLSIHTLAEIGYEPMAVASLAVLTGTSGPVDAIPDMAELARRFDVKSVTKSSAKFDPGELDSLNRKLLHALEYRSVKHRLAELGVGGGEALWNAIRENLNILPEAKDWWAMIETATPQIDPADVEFLRNAASLLPDEPWDGNIWSSWITAIKANTQRKGKGLFMPLRKALTGREHGPELDRILPLIGRERTMDRLS